MNQIRIALTLFICFICSVARTQDTMEYRNRFQVGDGIHYLASQDQIFSPFILTDVSLMNVWIAYQHQNKYLQMAEIQFGTFDPVYQSTFSYFTNPDSEELVTNKNDFTCVKVNYAIAKEIRSAAKYKWHLGIMSEDTVHAQNYYAGFFSTFGYFASFGISAWSQFDYDINEKQTLHARAYTPLFAWVCRSPYLANDDVFINNISSHNGFKTFFAYVGDGSLKTVNHLQQFDLQLDYRYLICKQWELGAGYQFIFIHASEPLNLLVYQNGFNLFTSFKF